jgi:hypothetical protein
VHDVPVRVDATDLVRKRPVFVGVGRELMQRPGQRQSWLSGEVDVWAARPDASCRTAAVGRMRALQDVGNGGLGPTRLRAPNETRGWRVGRAWRSSSFPTISGR